MSMIIEINAEAEYLRVRAHGEFSLDKAKETFLEMLEAVIKHRSRKVLFDGRGLTGEITMMERFYYGTFIARAVVQSADPLLTRITRFAYVLEHPILDPQRYGETVAVNRGMNGKAFDNLEDALRWLDVSIDNTTDASNG
jgi:hypothetical protein